MSEENLEEKVKKLEEQVEGLERKLATVVRMEKRLFEFVMWFSKRRKEIAKEDELEVDKKLRELGII